MFLSCDKMCQRWFIIFGFNKNTASTKQLLFIITIVLHTGISISVGCPKGYEYASESNTCEECTVSFYKPTSDNTTCQPCPEGYVTMDTASFDITNCSVPLKDTGRCSPGTIWISKEERCVPCPVSTYRSGGSDYVCLPCPDTLSTLNTGSVSRSQCLGRCDVGQQWDIKINTCEPCPKGSYSDTDSYLPCAQCSGSKETTLQSGAGSKSACYEPDTLDAEFADGNCPLGTSWFEDKHACVLCALNTYRDDRTFVCTPCPTDTFTILAGATHQGLCMPAQQVQLLQGQNIQDISCPVGMEVSFNPPGCSLCPQGTYRDSMSQPHCQLCGNNNQHQCVTQGRSNGRTPLPCPMGTEWHSNAQVCSLCPVGRYKSDMSSENCHLCSSGYTTWYTGATSNTSCVIPLSGNEVAFFTKDDCPLGTEWTAHIQGCTPCPLSYYRDRTSRHCIPCVTGYTTQSTGSVNLYQCVIPLHQSVYTITTDGCPHGMEPDMKDGMCKGCPHNTYKDTASPENCADCPSNMSGQRSITTSTHATNEMECHTDVLIQEVSPVKVLTTGGTEMSARLSTNASTIRIHSVFIDGVLCHHKHHLISNGKLVCTLDHFREPGSGPMAVFVIHGKNTVTRHTSSQKIEVVASPRVVQVDRVKFFLSGGVDIDIKVEDISAGTNVMAFWYTGVSKGPTEMTQCSALASSVICKVPKMKNYFGITEGNNNRRRRGSEFSSKVKRAAESEYDDSLTVSVGLSFDGWDYFRNLTEVLSENSSLRFFNDPIIHNLPGHPDIVQTYISQINLTVTFKGSHLSAGCLAKDYIMHIGDQICQVQELTDDHVTCLLDEQNFHSFENEILYETKVVIGNLLYSPGYVRAVDIPTPTTKESSGTEDKQEPAETAAQNSSNKKTLLIVLPAIAGLAVVMTLLVILLYLLLVRRKPKASVKAISTPASTWDPTLQSQSEILHVNQAALPPLPVVSVFGPDRLTDRGVTMRQLALPENIYSSGNDCA